MLRLSLCKWAVKIQKINNMAKEILLDGGKRKNIIKSLNTTYPTIRYALKFKGNTPIALRIREAALKNGGRLVEY